LLQEWMEKRHVHFAAREDAALGMATGAYLAGKTPVVFMQNSGFAHALNALSSLVIPYRIGLTLLVSWRGEHGQDSPEHEVLGEAFPKIVDALSICWWSLSERSYANVVEDAVAHSRTKSVSMIVVRKADL